MIPGSPLPLLEIIGRAIIVIAALLLLYINGQVLYWAWRVRRGR